VSGEHGTYRLAPLAPGRAYWVLARHPLVGSGATRPVAIEPGDVIPDIDVVVGGASGALHVTCLSLDGEPGGDVAVEVWAAHGGRPIGFGETRADGELLLEGLPPGPVEVVAKAPGPRTERRRRATVYEGRTTRVSLVAAAGAGVLAGRVVDSDDSPGWAVVTASTSDGGRYYALQAKTDGEGAFRFEGLSPLRYELRARGNRGGTSLPLLGVRPDRTDLLLVVDGASRYGLVRGVVEESPPDYSGWLQLSFRWHYRGPRRSGTYSFDLLRSAGGAFEVRTSGAEAFDIAAITEDGRVGLALDVKAPSGTLTDDVRLAPVAPATLRGRVLDELTGEGIAAATVAIEPWAPFADDQRRYRAPPWGAMTLRKADVVTGRDGAFEAVTLPAQRYRMTVSAPANQGRTQEHDGLPPGVHDLPDIVLPRTRVTQ